MQMNQFVDDQLKKEICFGETLIISCGHYEGDIGEESSDSEWSCHDSSESSTTEEIKDETMLEIKDRVEEEAVDEQADEEDDDFHFYFFPDCSKPPPPKDSKASLLIVDGMPKINPNAKGPPPCTCDRDKKGKCVCTIKLPCTCGAKTKEECVCPKAENICICHDGRPQPVCTCKGSDVCLCHPDGHIRAKCTCDQVDKPCICHPRTKFPSPVCVCKHKPKYEPPLDAIKSVTQTAEEGSEEQTVLEEQIVQEEQGETEKLELEVESEQEPCTCQKPDPKPVCRCLKGKKCICNQDTCVCGVQRTCTCEPEDGEEPICKSDDSKSICSCPVNVDCKCDAASPEDCKCFPVENCKCGADPGKCKCFTVCDCSIPCICDTKVDDDECICLDKTKQLVKGIVCTCASKHEKDDPVKLKRMRAGKHGYRWCHEVDPHHTYFDFGYGRHDKISYKAQEREKIKILGLGDEEEVEEVCAVHGVKAPPYKKKVRKPSIDCCSAVGGELRPFILMLTLYISN